MKKVELQEESVLVEDENRYRDRGESAFWIEVVKIRPVKSIQEFKPVQQSRTRTTRDALIANPTSSKNGFRKTDYAVLFSSRILASLAASSSLATRIL